MTERSDDRRRRRAGAVDARLDQARCPSDGNEPARVVIPEAAPDGIGQRVDSPEMPTLAAEDIDLAAITTRHRELGRRERRWWRKPTDGVDPLQGRTRDARRREREAVGDDEKAVVGRDRDGEREELRGRRLATVAEVGRRVRGLAQTGDGIDRPVRTDLPNHAEVEHEEAAIGPQDDVPDVEEACDSRLVAVATRWKVHARARRAAGDGSNDSVGRDPAHRRRRAGIVREQDAAVRGEGKTTNHNRRLGCGAAVARCAEAAAGASNRVDDALRTYPTDALELVEINARVRADNDPIRRS